MAPFGMPFEPHGRLLAIPTPSESLAMKNMHLIVALGLTAGSLALADGLGNGLADPASPHNFTQNLTGSDSWNKREEICRVCHVPHDHNRSQMYGNNGLLWNHEVSTASYTMYSSPTLDGSIAAGPTGISKMCMGCHDGTVAIDTFDRYSGGAVFIDDYNPGFQVPGGLYAGSLAQTHPISIVYDEVADPGLNAKTAPMGASGTIADVLENGDTVQCSSCHDVHDQPNESVPGTHLLRVSQKASQGAPSGLCLTCHIK